jgi:outer membrane lipoprotein-sorting protein
VDATTSLWVAQDDYRVVRAVTTDGTNRTVVAVESTAFNVSIHESTFEPPNNRIALTTHDQYDDFAAAQQATDLSLPRLDGTFAEASVTVRQNETIVGQRYVTDDGNVSIVSTTATDRFDRVSENASTTTIDGQTVTVTTAEDRAIAAWTDDGVTTAVVVEGSTDRAVAVAGDLSR